MNILCNGVYTYIIFILFSQNDFLFLWHNYVIIMFCCIGSHSMFVKTHVNTFMFNWKSHHSCLTTN